MSDVWVDAPEQLVRYLEIDLNSGKKRLVPMTLARIWDDRVRVMALASDSFDGHPGHEVGNRSDQARGRQDLGLCRLGVDVRRTQAQARVLTADR